ncbi:MAG: CidA/LrgA family protein [Betaproteobacteria bacterium]|nr:MAG: CidA/LrgA family protein [Betaproteobacteria bacterium]
MDGLKGFAWILLAQSLGEIVSRALKLPLPGPVVGLILMLFALQIPLVRRHVSVAADVLLAHLSLLFVPIGVGVLSHLDLISQYGFRILLALAVSTWIGLAVTAVIFRSVNARRAKGAVEPPANPS